MVKKVVDKKMKKDKIISVRLNKTNLQLFNQLNITPTQLFNFALKKYQEEHISTEKALVLSSIQSTIVDLHNSKLEVAAKQKNLDDLRKELLKIESNEYSTQRNRLMPLLEERYEVEVKNPDSKVDCVESFFKECKVFIELKKMKYNISSENLNKILDEFYSMKAREIEYDSLVDGVEIKNNL